jgi:hypothetical protein
MLIADASNDATVNLFSRIDTSRLPADARSRGAKGSWTWPDRQQAARRRMQVPLSQAGTSSPSLHGRKRLPRSFLGRAMGEPASLTQQSPSAAHGTGSTQT